MEPELLRVRRASARLRSAQREFIDAVRAARDARHSLRAIGAQAGVSHQRIAQIAEDIDWKALTPEERFWSKVVEAPDGSGCLIWDGKRVADYGVFKVDGQRVYVHRWIYEQRKGPIPDGFQIDHLCRNRLCANPDHLEAVTVEENVARAWRVGRQNGRGALKTHCLRGHEYTPENTYWPPDDMARQCRACRKIRDASRRR